MTIEQALDLAEKGRSIGPKLLLLVDDRHEALAHAQLAYSALVIVADKLREAEQFLLELTENNTQLAQLLRGAMQQVEPTYTAPWLGDFSVEFRTDTRTGIDHFPEIVNAIAREISDTLEG